MHRILVALALLAAALGVAPPADAGVVRCAGRPATMVFGPGDNHVRGTTGDDVVVLGAGDDVYQRDDGGDDIVCGGPGDDVVSAVSAGNDVILLGPGDDWAQAWYDAEVAGGPGADTITWATRPSPAAAAATTRSPPRSARPACSEARARTVCR